MLHAQQLCARIRSAGKGMSTKSKPLKVVRPKAPNGDYGSFGSW